MFSARIILDSISPAGKRLVTVEARYPRIVHSELLTHRAFARNAASSRAIPWPKMMAAITETPFIPIKWGAEQRGMQSGDQIEDTAEAERIWLTARDNAVGAAKALAELGVHKSICNRITEPWMWITTLITATEWNNFFRLRCHSDAEVHFQKIATMIREAMAESTPTRLNITNWHLPFIQDDELGHHDSVLKRVSVARCARVSYLTHDGNRDIQKDLDLFEKLSNGSGFGHYSPYEHVATPTFDANERSGPFLGWCQFRKAFPFENLEG